MRVISLLPSATETLCLVGGSELLVGRSHECDFPASILNRPVLTGQITRFTSSAEVDRQVASANTEGRSLYTLDSGLLAELRPDVILTQDLCDVCSIDLETVRSIAGAMDPAPRIVSLNPTTIEGVLDDILEVGEAVGLEKEAEREVVQLRERMARAADHVPGFAEGPPGVFMEWIDPIFVGGHWTPQLVERAGGSHPLNPTHPTEEGGAGMMAQGAERVAGKSVRVEIEDLVQSQPEWIVVCPCGLDLETTAKELESVRDQVWWRNLPAVKNGRVALVDGSQMFNRPGPRLIDAFEWLVGWMQGVESLMSHDFPWQGEDRV